MSSGTVMSHIEVNGRRLETRVIPGAAELPWLVFLHEGLGSLSLWRDFPEKLARRSGMRALIYSRQGYGRSAPLDGPREPDFMHHEALIVLPALLDAFGIGKAILVGHSDGASIALIHAAHRPGLVKGAVLMAPHVMVEPVSIASIARVAATYALGELRARLSRHHEHVDDAFLGWSRIWLDPRFRGWSLEAECRRLTVPLLLIQGENDEYGTLAQLDTIERLVPATATRLVLPDCGHSPQRDHEVAVLQAIEKFVVGMQA